MKWKKIAHHDVPTGADLFIALPVWSGSGEWKGWIYEAATFDGENFETECGSYEMDEVEYFAEIEAPPTPRKARN